MSSSNSPNKGTYWCSWFDAEFPAAAIDTNFFTHVYYAFLSLNENTFHLEIDAPTAVLLNNFTTTLHNKRPAVKTLFSIGGASQGTLIFSRMASNRESRRRFILSTIEVARKYAFDGVDLDWEFPETPDDMNNFGSLLDEWRAAVNNEANKTSRPKLLLVAATRYSPTIDWLNLTYPVDSINRNLDWLNAMCYDYHGSWDVSATGAPAALYDPNPNGNLSTSYGLQSWIGHGLAKEKLVMGLPLYAHTWQLRDEALTGIGAPAVGVGPGNEGTMSYVEVQNFNAQNNAIVVFDQQTVSTYSVAGRSWIGYDDVQSTRSKVAYARQQNLRGYFFWHVGCDQNWNISREASITWGP
ncbi:unnamed protein product [Lactuca saligna]|uniref:GH18 domain-containing protein n=1 Tax=Lactuca saligna TaxID=75948 RepID=A0AA35VJQ9_LACSI|nr:unnamed protein product [Lactuca saligna]